MPRLRRLTLAVTPILFLVLLLLTPMAYSSPPDPTWIHGLYDGEDFDDVVVVITSGAGIVELTPHADLSLALPPIMWDVPSCDGFVSSESTGSLRSRAPPAR